MTEPITLQSILTILGLIVAIVAGLTAIGGIIKWINGVHDKMEKWDSYEEQIKEMQTDVEARLQEIRTEQCIITSSVFAILDGLKQLNCNGKVTAAHERLEAYLNESSHGQKKGANNG